MIQFAKTFPDSMKSKFVLIKELTEWQENGLKLVGKYVEPELLGKVFKEYSCILKQINEKVIDLENNIGEVKDKFF